MKKALKLALLLGLYLFAPASALADTPEAAVQSAIAAVKSSGKPAAILDYVHWDSAFANLPPAQRAAMKVSTPADLKAFYTRAINQPEAMIDEHFQQIVGNVPPAQKAMIETQMAQMKATMREKIKATEQKVVNAKYEVKGSEVSGNKATVKIESTNPGEQPEMHTINLVNVDGRWLLSGILQPGAVTQH